MSLWDLGRKTSSLDSLLIHYTANFQSLTQFRGVVYGGGTSSKKMCKQHLSMSQIYTPFFALKARRQFLWFQLEECFFCNAFRAYETHQIMQSALSLSLLSTSLPIYGDLQTLGNCNIRILDYMATAAALNVYANLLFFLLYFIGQKWSRSFLQFSRV